MKKYKSLASVLFTICIILQLLPLDSVKASVTVPPKAPSNLAGTFYPPNTALLTWKDNSNDEVEFFLNISYKCPNNKGVYLSAQIVVRVAKNTTSATYSMQNGCTYIINVQASGAAKPGFYNLSAKSNSITLIAPPFQPSDLKVTKDSKNNLNTSWNDNSNNEGIFALILGYKGGIKVVAIPANMRTYAIPANALPASAKNGLEIKVAALPASAPETLALPSSFKPGQEISKEIVMPFLAIPANSIAKYMTSSLYLPLLFGSNLVSVK
jgi:hypothetical protein